MKGIHPHAQISKHQKELTYMVQQTDQIHNNIFHWCFQSNNVEDGIMKTKRMKLIETSDVFVYKYSVYAAL